MKFLDKLNKCTSKNNSLLCVGLDPDLDRIPEFLKQKEFPLFEFNKAIIDATHDLVCAYKPNSAFYEALGDRGVKELKMTCNYIKQSYPQIPIILDAKRADIGNTNNGYIKYAYEYLCVDAITLNPYLGKDAMQPFLNLKEKGCIILCKTSNIGAGELQDLKIEDVPLYKIIAKKIVRDWNKFSNCLLVVGAVYPDELKEIRQIVGDITILVPGIGTQGGDLGKSINAGLNSKNSGLIISVSRAIIYASAKTDYAQKARIESQRLREQINEYRDKYAK